MNETRRAYRSKPQAVASLLAAILAPVLLVGSLWSAGAPPIGAAVVGTFIAAAASMWFLRCAWAGVFVQADGVKIANPWRTRFVAWGQIDRFSFAPFSFDTWPLGGFGFVYLRNGDAWRLYGIQGVNPLGRNRRARALTEELNALVRAHTG